MEHPFSPQDSRAHAGTGTIAILISAQPDASGSWHLYLQPNSPQGADRVSRTPIDALIGARAELLAIADDPIRAYPDRYVLGGRLRARSARVAVSTSWPGPQRQFRARWRRLTGLRCHALMAPAAERRAWGAGAARPRCGWRSLRGSAGAAIMSSTLRRPLLSFPHGSCHVHEATPRGVTLNL